MRKTTRIRRPNTPSQIISRKRGCQGEVLPGPRHGFHKIRFAIEGEPKVSIVIPSAARIVEYQGERLDLLRMCVGSILEKSTYKNYEIVVVDNGDLRPELQSWLEGKVRMVTYRAPRFNLAEKMNLGARQATGEHLILLNDDIKIISPDWIEQMLQYSQQPGGGRGRREAAVSESPHSACRYCASERESGTCVL